MPSNQTHVKHSISDKKTAKEIHRMLDYPFGITHQEYRTLTHNPQTAFILGYSRGGRKGALDALRHILDDMYVTQMNELISSDNNR